MRNKLSVVLFIAASACMVVASPGIDVTGTWTGEVKGQDGGTGQVRFVLRQEGERISGTARPIDKDNPGRGYDAKLGGGHLTFAADHTHEGTRLQLTYHIDLTRWRDRMQG